MQIHLPFTYFTGVGELCFLVAFQFVKISGSKKIMHCIKQLIDLKGT